MEGIALGLGLGGPIGDGVLLIFSEKGVEVTGEVGALVAGAGTELIV